LLVPADTAGSFLIHNKQLDFAGDIKSHIDREMYLFGSYEGLEIGCFLDVVQQRPRRVLLDIGANVGTHSLRFARHFDSVHSFEPNPSVWSSFDRNVSINHLQNVTLHRVGLGEQDADLPLFAIDSLNDGLGTFLADEQYDRPLKCIGRSKIANGDTYIQAHNIGPVDAVKIDVQGFEPMVLRGLRATLASSRPVVWFEYGAGTRGAVTATDLRDWFPFEINLFRLLHNNARLLHNVKLVPTDANTAADTPLGDYLAVPCAS
jgi:FkbM family methyltransferase